MSKIICKCGNILPDITDNLFRESIPFFARRKTEKEIFWIMMAKKKPNICFEEQFYRKGSYSYFAY